MARIAVVEDDRTVCEMLEIFLHKEGHETEFYHGGMLEAEKILSANPDLVILDWMLPGKDGLTLLKELRKVSSIPVIMLTAKDGDIDQVLGLESGADDYVTKPFSPFTLLARIKAVLRRAEHHRVPEGEGSEAWIAGKRFRIDPVTYEVILCERKIENLTPKEFELLAFMARSPRHVFSREQLIERVWGFDFVGDERTVDAHIKRLRKKIHVPPYSWIHTIWGIGYKFDEDLQDEA